MVADAHLEGSDDPAQGDFLLWLDDLSADRLVLLGDIFHHWWTWRGLPADEYSNVLDALDRVVARGIALTIVPGNHDFFDMDYFQKRFGAAPNDPQMLELDGHRVWLSHGDGADHSFGYWLVRTVLRGRLFSVFLKILGPSWGMGLLRRLAGHREVYATASHPLATAQIAMADVALDRGADVAVMGHIHLGHIHHRDNGTVVQMGDWCSARSWLEMENGALQLFRWNEQKQPVPWQQRTRSEPL